MGSKSLVDEYELQKYMAANYDGVVEACSGTVISQVRTYNEDQLRGLLNDESMLDSLILTLPQMSTLNAEKESKMIRCKTLAQENLQFEPKFVETKERLRRTLEEVQKITEEIQRLDAEVKSNGHDQSVEDASVLLQAATQKAEDESEKLADDFLESAVEVDDFIKTFIDKRALYHLRKVKTEKLQEQMRPSNTSSYRPYSQPLPLHPASGYRQVGRNVYPNAYRHSNFS